MPTSNDDESTTEDDGSRKRKTRRKVDLYSRNLRSIDANLAKLCRDKTFCVSDVRSNTAVLETIQSAPGLSGTCTSSKGSRMGNVDADAIRPRVHHADRQHIS